MVRKYDMPVLPEYDGSVAQTVNSDRYSHVLTNVFFLRREIDDMGTSHTARTGLALFRETLHFPKSYDFSPLDFFL